MCLLWSPGRAGEAAAAARQQAGWTRARDEDQAGESGRSAGQQVDRHHEVGKAHLYSSSFELLCENRELGMAYMYSSLLILWEKLLYVLGICSFLVKQQSVDIIVKVDCLLFSGLCKIMMFA